MTVYTHISGQGETLLALHGWGMNHGVWSTIDADLELYFRVIRVDLPGHGKSATCPLESLDQVVDLLLTILDALEQTQKIHIMGWSLGGLIAQRLAEYAPNRVASLLLIATTPCFIQMKNWPHAMPSALLLDFYKNLEDDFALTIKRFIALQFMGVRGVQSQLKQLREAVLATPPERKALQQGLSILQATDLREAQIHCPVLWVLGALDKLVPVTVADDLQAMNDRQRVDVIKGAGHAPFISHPDEFLQCIYSFLLSEYS